MRFSLSYKWYRVMGISGLFLIGYIVVIGLFGNFDISRFLPMKLATSIRDAWPKLPFFKVETDSVDHGRGEEIRYTVPTRQFTPQEIARMMGANRVDHPAAPAPATSKAQSAR